MHATAGLLGTTIASSSTYEFVEGNVYFPLSSLESGTPDVQFKPSEHTTWCPWKGEAKYYDVHVHGTVIENGAWYYPQPLEKAVHIKDHVAFYKSKIQVDRS